MPISLGAPYGTEQSGQELQGAAVLPQEIRRLGTHGSKKKPKNGGSILGVSYVYGSKWSKSSRPNHGFKSLFSTHRLLATQ